MNEVFIGDVKMLYPSMNGPELLVIRWDNTGRKGVCEKLGKYDKERNVCVTSNGVKRYTCKWINFCHAKSSRDTLTTVHGDSICLHCANRKNFYCKAVVQPNETCCGTWNKCKYYKSKDSNIEVGN